MVLSSAVVLSKAVPVAIAKPVSSVVVAPSTVDNAGGVVTTSIAVAVGVVAPPHLGDRVYVVQPTQLFMSTGALLLKIRQRCGVEP